jgi:hypothetical protein
VGTRRHADDRKGNIKSIEVRGAGSHPPHVFSWTRTDYAKGINFCTSNCK